jgi:hypothetical protein
MNFILDELPMDQGWAFISWTVENDGWLQFSGIAREGKGYVGQQADIRVKEALEAWRKS